MSGERQGLTRASAEVLLQFEKLRTFVLASIEIAEEHKETLENRIDSETGAVRRKLEERLEAVKDWLNRGEFLRAWLIDQAHDLGVTIRKARMGILESSYEAVKRLHQASRRKHLSVAVGFLEAAGNGCYEKAVELAEKRERGDTIQESEELESLRNELDEVDTILEEDLDDLNAGHPDADTIAGEDVAAAHGAGADGADHDIRGDTAGPPDGGSGRSSPDNPVDDGFGAVGPDDDRRHDNSPNRDLLGGD